MHAHITDWEVGTKNSYFWSQNWPECLISVNSTLLGKQSHWNHIWVAFKNNWDNVPSSTSIIIHMYADDDKLSQLFLGVNFYMVSMTVLFGPKNTYFSSPSVNQYQIDACRWWKPMPFVCRSRLLLGLHELPRINKVFNTNIHNLSVFWAHKTYFSSPSVNQYHVNARRSCQTVLIVFSSRLIYGFNVFACLYKVLYTNIYSLGHYWAQN